MASPEKDIVRAVLGYLRCSRFIFWRIKTNILPFIVNQGHMLTWFWPYKSKEISK